MSTKQIRSLIAGLMLMLCYGLCNNTVSFFIAPVSEALGIPRASFNLYFTIMSMVTLFSTPFIGQLIQKTDVRKIMAVGAGVGFAAFMCFSFCPKITFFYVVAVFLGVVYNGCTSVSAVVIVNREFSGSKLSGIATGIIMAGTGVCSTIMGLVLPPVIQNTSWRMGYRLEAVLWLVMFVLAILLVGSEEKKTNSVSGKNVAQSAQKIGATYAQAIKSPILYLHIVLTVLLVLDTIFVQHMPAFFQELGSDAVTAGKIMSVCSIVLIVGKIGLGAVYDVLGPVKTIILDYGALVVSYYIMLMGNTACMWIGALLACFGMCSSTVLLPLITKQVFGEKEYAAIWSMIAMSVSLGAAVGSPLWGAVYDFFGSYKPAVSVFPILEIAVTAGVVFMLKKYKASDWEDK